MKIHGNVIFVEDEKKLNLVYKRDLQCMGYEVDCFESAEKALPHIIPDWPGVLVSDVMMPDMDGLTLMKKVKKIDPDLPVILVTGIGDIQMAVQAIKDGAYDFIEKPFEMESLHKILLHALEKRRFVMELRKLRAEIASLDETANIIIGRSPVMEMLRQVVRNVAESPADVLILGETGTGKELVAKSLHSMSRRKEHPFVPIDCGAIPETIIESELFGHEVGAYTGAHQRRIGKFEYANHGTVFLDEIENMPLHLQPKLLRVLQERVVCRMGSNELIKLDIRVLAASKVDLKNACDQNLFRKDLFYRLNVVQIPLAPLREHKEDIPLLFQHFVKQSALRHNHSEPKISKDYMRDLLMGSWEGNIRELKNEAEKYALGLNLDEGYLSHSMKISSSFQHFQKKSLDFSGQMSEFEKIIIENELICHKGNIKKVLDSLKIPRQTLRDKMKRYELHRKNYF